MTSITLLLDGNPDNIIWTGKLVFGRILIETKKRIKMRGIRLEMSGRANSQWMTSPGGRSTRNIGVGNYINLEKYLTGSRNKASKLYLEPGVHNFPICFMVPSAFPQSLESVGGSVRYTAKAVLDCPMGKNHTAEVKLTVARLFDLNKEPARLREPISRHNPGEVLKESRDCCCCCYFLNGTVETTLRVNRGCFAPGDKILVDGEFRNVSADGVKRTSIAFVQKRVYGQYGIPNGNFNERESVIAEVQRPGVAKGQTERFQNIEFLVPFLPPSRADGCTFIHIEYYLEMRVRYSVVTTCNGRCQIIIGNVPLDDASHPTVVTSQTMPSSTVTSQPVLSSMVTSQPESYSAVKSQPDPSSTVKSQTGPYSTVTSQPEPYSMPQPSRTDEFPLTPSFVAHPSTVSLFCEEKQSSGDNVN